MTALSLLSPVARACPWGSRTAIPALLGQRPDGEPQADLAAAVDADPVGELGEASLDGHDREEAAGVPLSARHPARVPVGVAS